MFERNATGALTRSQERQLWHALDDDSLDTLSQAFSQQNVLGHLAYRLSIQLTRLLIPHLQPAS